MYKIAVILPSRGLIFSQTADEILQNVKGIPHKFFFSHRKPIPECFETPTKRALEDKDITHLWFVEDDMILPPTILQELLDKDMAVVTADYPITKKGRGSVFSVGKEVVFCGTGCLLVKREVFEELKQPYFRSDMKWNIKNYGDFLKMTRSRNETFDGYGLHDINFCMALYGKNIPIHVVDTKLGQRKLKNLGKSGTNNGAHNIEEWRKVVKDQRLKELRALPVLPSGNLVTVVTDEGEVMVTKDHAKKLVDKRLAKQPPKREIVVDWGVE